MRRSILVLFGLLTLGTALIAADNDRKKTPIALKELNDDYEIIGKLGVPMGHVVTIDATVDLSGNQRAKIAPFTLRITAIDGRRLEKPVEFDQPYHESLNEQWEAPHGSTHRLRVYESGGFRGMPEKAREEMGVPERPVAEVNDEYGFSTQLFIIRELKSDAVPKAQK